MSKEMKKINQQIGRLKGQLGLTNISQDRAVSLGVTLGAEKAMKKIETAYRNRNANQKKIAELEKRKNKIQMKLDRYRKA